jgi:hypothetical protein
MRSNVQEQAWETNEKTIKQELAKQNLTFTDLIEKTGLCRAVINQHLKELVKNEKVNKKYENGKVLNVLTENGRADLGPLYDFAYSKDILEMVNRADKDFKETLNPAGFFYYMNSYLDLMLLTTVPIIRNLANIKTDEKKSEVDILKEKITETTIDLFISDVARVFARDFLDIILKHGKELDVDALMKELKTRIKKQAV